MTLMMSACDCGLVDYILCKAFSFLWALVFLSAVASFVACLCLLQLVI